MTNWKNKLLAYLHDPPEKAYDYGPRHQQRAEHYRNLVLGAGTWQEHDPDHVAAAADRFIFPTTRRWQNGRWVDTGVAGLGGEVAFKHPLTGQTSLRLEDAQFPEQSAAEAAVDDGVPSYAGVDDPQIKFWLLWRLWLQFTVTNPNQRARGAESLAYLPADTRIPDGSIWHHNSIVSALEATRAVDGILRPAFLVFQIGPVQEFIAQARSTRDLWSGSYLLSWMMAHAMKVVADELGPDNIVHPSLRGQPLYDWLEQEKLKVAKHRQGATESKNFWDDCKLDHPASQELALTPTFPNRFLAVVPAGFDPRKLEAVFDAEDPQSEWSQVARACWEFLNDREKLPDAASSLWQDQIRHFWQITWQLWPWEDVPSTLELFKVIPLGQNSNLPAGHQVAWAIPAPHQDERCYRDGKTQGKLSKGWTWSAHYQLLSHRHDARRQTRDFTAWPATAQAHKDHFSGKEEVIATKVWLERARKIEALRHLFRNDDELGAVNLIKRIWHVAYLAAEIPGKPKLQRARESFDSIPAIAASSFAFRLFERTATEGKLRELLTGAAGFANAASAARKFFPAAIAEWNRSNEEDWFRFTDAAVFHTHEWEQAIIYCEDVEGKRALAKAMTALQGLLNEFGGAPSKYYAVLALDGDEIGKWLSGERTPRICEVTTGKAADYFRENVKATGVDVEAWLKSPRPLSPSYHLQFSEAMANFGLYCARRIVEAHHGQLIYAGGDDVLALLPADEAIACALGLRLAFQGSNELPKRYPVLFAESPDGFFKLKDGDWNGGCRRSAEPIWPLLVPGPRATVSVGLAIGHIKEPLQDMIHEAQLAEKRAKAAPQKEVFDRQSKLKVWKLNEGWGRDALAVTLFKRSGETIRWGTRFDSPAFALLAQLRQFYRAPLDAPGIAMPISGKFPYRVAELLGRYEVDKPLDSEPQLRNIVGRELAWAIQQQTWKDTQAEEAGSDFRRADFENACLAYLDSLRDFQWDRPAANGRKQRVKASRPLREFINLFAVEAFIARTGE